MVENVKSCAPLLSSFLLSVPISQNLMRERSLLNIVQFLDVIHLTSIWTSKYQFSILEVETTNFDTSSTSSIRGTILLDRLVQYFNAFTPSLHVFQSLAPVEFCQSSISIGTISREFYLQYPPCHRINRQQSVSRSRKIAGRDALILKAPGGARGRGGGNDRERRAASSLQTWFVNGLGKLYKTWNFQWAFVLSLRHFLHF